jgi:endonuclease I
MKTVQLLFCLSITSILLAQQSYYNNVNLTLTGEALYNELQDKIDINNTTFTYGDVRDTMLETDEDPDNSQNVLLVYGYSNSSCVTERTRNKQEFGGNSCNFNREHVFSRSNADPEMGGTSNIFTGIVADPHNLRSSDVQMNGNRGNKKFAAGSGTSGDVNGNWYPGDEWKGDVARMMMYMYTRYGDRCLPSLNGTGALQSGNNMLQVYLQWNVEDPVDTTFEDQRNNYLETAYGNRNPFIDNPYLATIIWGGAPAEDRWGTLSVGNNNGQGFTIYPNPATDTIAISSTDSQASYSVVIYSISGKKIKEVPSIKVYESMDISTLTSGIYILTIESSEKVRTTQKLVVK